MVHAGRNDARLTVDDVQTHDLSRVLQTTQTDIDWSNAAVGVDCTTHGLNRVAVVHERQEGMHVYADERSAGAEEVERGRVGAHDFAVGSGHEQRNREHLEQRSNLRLDQRECQLMGIQRFRACWLRGRQPVPLVWPAASRGHQDWSHSND